MSFSRTVGIITSWVGMLLGVGIIIGSLLLFRKKYIKAVGKVKKVDCKRTPADSTTYACEMEVSFTTQKNEDVITTTAVHSNTYYILGQDIVIYYSPTNPKVIDIGESLPETKVMGWVLAVLGSILLLASIVSLALTTRDTTLRVVSPVPVPVRVPTPALAPAPIPPRVPPTLIPAPAPVPRPPSVYAFPEITPAPAPAPVLAPVPATKNEIL